MTASAAEDALREELARLRKLASGSREAGDDKAEAEALEAAAAVHTALEQYEEAKKKLRAARDLHAAAGRADREAKVSYGIGLLEKRNGPTPAAQRELGLALEGFERQGDPVMIGRTRAHLAMLAVEGERFDEADRLLADAASAFDEAGLTGEAIDAHRARAMTFHMREMPTEAMAVLSEAIVRADQLADGPGRLALRLDMNAVAMGIEGADGPSLDAILRDAVAEGDRSAAGQALLARAGRHLMEGRWQEAGDDAQAAREVALDLVDPVMYTIACLTIAEAAAKLGDRVTSLGVLLTCRSALADLLGEEAGDPVLVVIDSMRQRWGEDEYQQVLADYRALFADEPES